MLRFIPFLPKPPVVPVIRLQGAIGGTSRFGGAGLTDVGLAPILDRAFRRMRPAAVALVINSPGGSPVQSSLIAARIRRLAEEHKVPVHAFVEDMAGSGGYWLATAADDIWIDANSLVGSIGVISAGFGFHELIGRYGVERRVHTAGRSKSFLDPFRPQDEAEIARLRTLIEPMHANFIAQVRDRRGARLREEAADLFTGDVWIGAQAVELGLADGIDHLEPRMQAVFGPKVRLVPLGQRRSLFQRFGAEVVDGAAGAATEAALRSRYGGGL